MAVIDPAVIRSTRQRLLRWTGKPAVEVGFTCLCAMGTAFLLAGIRVCGSFLPLAVCYAAALGLGLPSFAAYGGACLGYTVFFGIQTALEPISVGLLTEACLCIFGEELPRENKWFSAVSTAVFSVLVGVLFLLQGRISSRAIGLHAMYPAAAGLGAVSFWQALNGKGSHCKLILPVCLCGGLCAISIQALPLGAIGACALAAAASGTAASLPAAVLSGIALELCWPEGGACTVVLAAGALFSFRHKKIIFRQLLWIAAVFTAVLITGGTKLFIAAAAAGSIFSFFPKIRSRFDLPEETSSVSGIPLLSQLLKQLSQCLSLPKTPRPDPETNTVFDRAAERVCRHCSIWATCWETDTDTTCEALNQAAPPMMTRGKALRQDFPLWFSQRCCHMEGFLTAVNRELDDLRCRRQYRSRLREYRQIMAQQYDVLASALCKTCQPSSEACIFQAEVGFRSQSLHGDVVSGDRGAGFRWGTHFYLLLCDGMGTGSGAHGEAGSAIGILRSLLQSAVPPVHALQLLNGIYLLRDDGGFSTVDLLEVDLSTGNGCLYKWGSAPSYLKYRDNVSKIVTASLPPGIGVGEIHRPAEERLSLGRGEMVILVSDGIDEGSAERALRLYEGSSPRELAAVILGSSRACGEDDRTAAVVVLRPCFSA